MNKHIGKGILLGFYFSICAFYLRALMPYFRILRYNFPDVLAGKVTLPELPDSLIIGLVLFAFFNVVFFGQIFEAFSDKKENKAEKDDD